LKKAKTRNIIICIKVRDKCNWTKAIRIHLVLQVTKLNCQDKDNLMPQLTVTLTFLIRNYKNLDFCLKLTKQIQNFIQKVTFNKKNTSQKLINRVLINKTQQILVTKDKQAIRVRQILNY